MIFSDFNEQDFFLFFFFFLQFLFNHGLKGITFFNHGLKGITFIKMFIAKQMTQHFMHTNANTHFFKMKFL